ncbi:C40 family peptidase [Oceanobacillus luteolus]|uniref:NlpC/P60 family protein n=1 Tax=Oceanobacillus luteolus TaxID=1274358 RepID=A0ABW4HVR8_9BACI|nr:C40 family peptidase [Oceanobacillus luteolus]MCM3741981.1 C40 family peptidase [Oceanobacillus luteolus]
MFKHSFPLPETFHVSSVQVATIWTEPESPRLIDELATGNPTDIKRWLEELSKEEKLALISEDRIQTQILYGEAVVVTEVRGDWAQVYVPSQPSRKDKRGYPGWVPLSQLKQVSRKTWFQPEMAAVKLESVWLENEAGEKLIHLSYMTCLPVQNVGADRVEVATPQGKGYLPKEAVELFLTEDGGERKPGQSIIDSAAKFIGLEYLWGGMSAFGYDCSGFTYGMHKANGYQISRDASDQAEGGKDVSLDELMPGDLLFFAKGKARIHHVGIYYGDGKMLHAPSTGKGIEIVSLAGTKHEQQLCSARRYWDVGEK